MGVSAEVLLVEDNLPDVELLKLAMRESPMRRSIRLHVVHDAEAAVGFLRRQEPFEQVPRPDLVLLDLDLPGRDGSAVLADIRADPRLTHLPVVVFTSSNDPADVLTAYRLHANGYVAKPVDYDGFRKVVESIGGFWLTVARLPGRAG